MKKLLTTLLFSLPFVLSADDAVKINDYEFNQEKMIVDRGEIHLVSSFDTEDVLALYNFNGQRLWEARFHSKIIATDIQRDVILVFSKARNGESTFLTCLNRINGRTLWEKP